MNCGPFSQEQLETLRAASSQISNRTSLGFPPGI